MNKGWIAAIVIVVVLIVARVGISLTKHKSDRDQIRQALQESVEAGKEGKASGVLELLGNDLSVNNQSAKEGMGQLSDFIKKSHPDVTFANIDPVVNGDHAQITSPATIDVNFLGQHRTVNLDSVVLIFQKEAATQYYVIPAQKWRLVQVQAPNFSPEQLSQ